MNETMEFVVKEDDGTGYRRITLAVSNHAMRRMKERAGIPKKSVARIAEKAYNEGVNIETITGYLRQWAKLKFKNNLDKKTKYMIYGSHLYIFSENGVLITIEQLPCRERVMKMLRGEKTASETDRKRKEKQDNKELKKKQAQQKRFSFSF